MFHSCTPLKYSCNKSIYFKGCNYEKSLFKKKVPVLLVKYPFTVSKKAISTGVHNYKFLKKSSIKLKEIRTEAIKRHLSLSTVRFNQSKNSKKPEEDPQENLYIVLKRFWIWAVASWALYFYLRDVHQRQDIFPAVISWEEFKNEMLAKGEVDKILVFDEASEIIIVLHKGAVIKNALVVSTFYLINAVLYHLTAN